MTPLQSIVAGPIVHVPALGVSGEKMIVPAMEHAP
jgi:hypothetical protein